MNPRLVRLVLSGLVVLFMLACSLFPTPGGTETPAPGATVSPGGEGEPTPQPSPGPLNYTGLLQQGVDSSAWTEGQGLVRSQRTHGLVMLLLGLALLAVAARSLWVSRKRGRAPGVVELVLAGLGLIQVVIGLLAVSER